MNKFNSEKYWIDRYRLRQGNSGAGSYGIYAEYKAKIINDFFIQNNITTVLELGCGDGNQLSLLKPKKYYGYDVSLLVVENNKLRFPNFIFSTNIADFLLMKYDVTMSLDVIYHLIEDDIYYLHMKHLFELSGKYVIIYSPNRFEKLSGEHNMFREFMVDIPENFELIQKIDNPLKGAYTQSDFYIFEKIIKMARVNIVMRTFNRLEYTVLTLREIDRLAGYDDYKIIIIDNASTDGTQQWLKSLVKEGWYKIKPIFLDYNAGDFGGTKIGYENLDPDCEYTMQWDNDYPPITEYFLRDLVKIMDAFPKIGQLMLKRNGVGGVIPITNKFEWEGLVIGDAHIITCVNMHRRKVVEEINFWVVDESTYWDFTLNAKMKERGYELKKVENIRTVHIDCYGTNETNYQRKKYPIYFKNKGNNGKINFNTTNYSD